MIKKSKKETPNIEKSKGNHSQECKHSILSQYIIVFHGQNTQSEINKYLTREAQQNKWTLHAFIIFSLSWLVSILHLGESPQDMSLWDYLGDGSLLSLEDCLGYACG